MKWLKNRLDENKLFDYYSNLLNEYYVNNFKTLSSGSTVNFKWLAENFLKSRNMYGKNRISGEYLLFDIINDYFTRFLRIKKNLPTEYRDITKIKNVQTLIKIIDEYNDYDDMKKDKNIDLIFFNERWFAFIPKTYEASKKWGWGRYCTSHDEDYYNMHNVNNKSLVYIRNKFDYTKNIAIECFYHNEYQWWTYENDNVLGNEYQLAVELESMDDGFLDVNKIINNIPYITKKDVLEHFLKYLYDNMSIEDINYYLDSDLEEKDLDDMRDAAKINSIEPYELRNNIIESF